MISVLCPACDQRIQGESSEELSENVRSHLESIHDVEGASFVTGDVREREPPKEPRRSPSRPLRPAPGSRLGESEEGSVSSSISGFRCPMCGSDIEGMGEEELTSAFRKHLTSMHKEEQFVAGLMERIGSR